MKALLLLAVWMLGVRLDAGTLSAASTYHVYEFGGFGFSGEEDLGGRIPVTSLIEPGLIYVAGQDLAEQSLVAWNSSISSGPGDEPVRTIPITFAEEAKGNLVAVQFEDGTLQLTQDAFALAAGSYLTMTAGQLAAAASINIAITNGAALVVSFSGTDVKIPASTSILDGTGANAELSSSILRRLLFSFNSASATSVGSFSWDRSWLSTNRL